MSLSGEYRIDKITYSQVDNSSSTNNIVYYPGDLYVNQSAVAPIDSIEVGFTRWHLDYSAIRFTAHSNTDGSTDWTDEYFYYVKGQVNEYDLGYFEFDIAGTKRVWKIIDDGAESIVFRTSGQWANGSAGANEQITLFLTRTGP